MTLRSRLYTKAPEDVLDYSWDWSVFLETGETISASSVTVPAGLTKDSETNDTTSVTVWLSGGEPGVVYNVYNVVSTTAGRTVRASIVIQMKAAI